MSPILGIFASQGRVASNSYESIATTTVGAGGSTSITFSSIPSTYKHLQVRYFARSGTGSSTDSIILQFNGDTSASYAYHVVYGNGASVLAAATTGGTFAKTGQLAISSNVFAGGVIDILDYTSTNKNKTIRALSGADFNGSGVVALESNIWLNTAAVTSINFQYSGSYAQYSQFALYGIRG